MPDSKGVRPRLRVDPRTKFLVVLATNVVVMGRAVEWVLALAVVIVVALLAVDVGTRPMLTLAALSTVSAVVVALPLRWPNTVTITLGVICYWVLSFAVALSVGGWFVKTTRVGDLIAAMTAARVPRVLLIPLSVIFRFLPVAVDETRGVFEAMALRGYTGRNLWRHPIVALERLVVPVLAASARIADELSAAALIRGLGSTRRPTIVADLRFHWGDGLLLVVAVGLVGAHIAHGVLA